MNWDRLGLQVDVVVVSNEIVAKSVNWRPLKPNWFCKLLSDMISRRRHSPLFYWENVHRFPVHVQVMD